MQKGVIDATIGDISFCVRFGFHEIAKYYTKETSLPGFTCPGAMMNLDKWNELSPDVQQIFMDLRREGVEVYYDMLQEDLSEHYNMAEAAGVELSQLSPEEMAHWISLPGFQNKYSEWVKFVVDNNILSEARASEIHEQFLELVKETIQELNSK
jgi:TRAP-type C4-dicarboxylate transport system substrate-binding protein